MRGPHSSPRMMSSSRTTITSRPHLTSLLYSLPVRRLKEILHHVFHSATLGHVVELPSPQLSRLYALTMSDKRELLLSFAPSLAVRLLRQEASLLSSEATLIQFIAESERRKNESLTASRDAQDDTSLSGLIPTLVKHSSSNTEMAYPYTIFEPTAGAPLSTLSIYLNLPERRLIDKRIGLMARSLASLTSPSGTFGLVGRVLTDPFASASSVAASEKMDSKTWSEGFNTLLEGILRDGEDMAVLIPYGTIRSHYQKLSYRLDVVTIPRLVVLDAGSEMNVMVETEVNERSSSLVTDRIKFTGLRSWSQGVFGDPLVANCFDDPSEGFLEGWREGGEDIMKDVEDVEIRILLYRCYRAVVTIVTEYYRPQADSSRRELEGRRKLTSTLAELEKIDATANTELKRSRRLEADAESSKRQKADMCNE